MSAAEAAAVADEVLAKAATRHVLWAPVLRPRRHAGGRGAGDWEVQLKQQAWLTVKAGEPAAVAAAKEEEAMEFEAAHAGEGRGRERRGAPCVPSMASARP